MIIAVDFDGTLCANAYPEIGEPKQTLIMALKKRQEHGDKLILWTCRENEMLDNAVSWCKEQGLFFDAINENVPETMEKWGHDSRKVTADLYIDDKSTAPWMVLMEGVD